MFLPIQHLNGLIYRCSLRRPSVCARHFVWLPTGNTKDIAPFRNTEANAIDSNDAIECGVSGLHSWQIPSAITRFIIAIVVNSIDRMQLRWTRPHVGVEVLKTAAPSVAHGNAASPIGVKFGIVRIVTAKFQLCPSLILWCAGHAMRWREAVFSDRFCRNLLSQASAAKCGSADIGRRRYGIIPAIASAIPHRVPIARVRRHFNDNGKPSEFLSLNVSHVYPRSNTTEYMRNGRVVN